MHTIPQNGCLRNRERALEDILEREQLSSTGIGGGFAVPHVFTEEANLPTLVFARSKEGIEFNARDGKPVHLLVLAFAHPKKKNFFIQCLYHVVQFLKDPEMFQQLMEADTKQAVLELFGYEDMSVQKSLLQPAYPEEQKQGEERISNPRLALGGFLARAAAEVGA
jgi:mannitol/fructose-specific phosphotransferase system IIA component (Ntr-type)